MYYSPGIKSMQKAVAIMLCPMAFALAGVVQAAPPVWTLPNRPNADMLALYHFDTESSVDREATVRTGVTSGTMVNHQLNHASLNPGFALEFYNFNAANVGTIGQSNDVPGAALQYSSLALEGIVQYRAKAANPDANNQHQTVEAWLKWDDAQTSADIQLGGSDRLLRIVRDAANPTNDAIGFQATHGGWRPHPGFTGFANLEEPIVDGQWFHVAMVIHNADMHEHSGHWYYEPGSFAMIFVNGKLVGTGTSDRIDISENDPDLVYHGSDRITLRTTAGTSRVLVDEFTVWSNDPTQGGTVTSGLFQEGRGNTASAENWMLFE